MRRLIQFQLDEQIDNAVAQALRRRGIVAFTISEAGFRGRRLDTEGMVGTVECF